MQERKQEKQPLWIQTLKIVPYSIKERKYKMNTKITVHKKLSSNRLYFRVYLSQILSAIKILLKQFLIDFLGSRDYEIQYLEGFKDPPWEDENVDKVAKQTKDGHQDHQDADHPGELKKSGVKISN